MLTLSDPSRDSEFDPNSVPELNLSKRVTQRYFPSKCFRAISMQPTTLKDSEGTTEKCQLVIMKRDRLILQWSRSAEALLCNNWQNTDRLQFPELLHGGSTHCLHWLF